MKGFTLVEIGLVILITAILAGISLRFTVFSPETLYLKNFVYKLGSNINLLRDFSLGRKLIDSNKVCGYGLLFKPTSSGYEYFGYVYATSVIGIECEFIALSSPTAFAPSSPLYYLHTNGEIRLNPLEPLQIKDLFKGKDFKISITSGNCLDNLFVSFNQIALVYYNPYGDLLLLGRNSSGWQNLLPSDWSNLYFCLKYKEEKRNFRINRAGQLIFENP